MTNNNSEVLLKVENLCQFFKMGSSKLKAVNNVSFEIKKGEVFGLVGESGCGKTTTGRSIIKLYNITSGSIYYKGVRISAGNRWNRKEIKFTKIRAKNKISELLEAKKQELATVQPGTIEYNEIAVRIMGKYNVPIINLYDFTLQLGDEAYDDHVHYTMEVRKLQAKFIAKELKRIMG